MDHRLQHSRIGNRPFVRPFRNLYPNDEGVSAVEFALLAPVLIFFLLAMADLGLALSERMTINHILRAGAQGATLDVGVPAVERILRATAARSMPLAIDSAKGDDTSLALKVRRIHSCAEQPFENVAPSTTCAGDAPTQIFYTLSGKKTYSGLILPRFSQSKDLQVQVR